MERISKKLGAKVGGALKYGMAQCPADGVDPGLLLPLAASRMAAAR